MTGLSGARPSGVQGEIPSSVSTMIRFLFGNLDLHRNHIAFLELPVVGHAHQILFVAADGHGVRFFFGHTAAHDSHIFSGLDHGLARHRDPC